LVSSETVVTFAGCGWFVPVTFRIGGMNSLPLVFSTVK
jgi:hypothetical protein